VETGQPINSQGVLLRWGGRKRLKLLDQPKKNKEARTLARDDEKSKVRSWTKKPQEVKVRLVTHMTGTRRKSKGHILIVLGVTTNKFQLGGGEWENS